MCHWDSLIKTSACFPSRRSQQPLQSDGNNLWKFQFSGIRMPASMTRSTARGTPRGSRWVQCHGCGKQLLELGRGMIHGVGMIPGDVLGSCPETSLETFLETNFDKVL